LLAAAKTRKISASNEQEALGAWYMPMLITVPSFVCYYLVIANNQRFPYLDVKDLSFCAIRSVIETHMKDHSASQFTMAFSIKGIPLCIESDYSIQFDE
jgi:hypothetical protein